MGTISQPLVGSLELLGSRQNELKGVSRNLIVNPFFEVFKVCCSHTFNCCNQLSKGTDRTT